MVVTPLAQGHVDQVVELEQSCFPHPWPRRVFEAHVTHPQSIALVCLSLPSSAVVGFLCLMLEWDDEDDRLPSAVQVQNLAVNQEYRGQGVARKLLLTGLGEAFRQGARSAWLEVRPSNLAARKLYRSLRFSNVGRKPRYYVIPPEDAMVLGCDLRTLFKLDPKIG